jgi:hypothetical protein
VSQRSTATRSAAFPSTTRVSRRRLSVIWISPMQSSWIMSDSASPGIEADGRGTRATAAGGARR